MLKKIIRFIRNCNTFVNVYYGRKNRFRKT